MAKKRHTGEQELPFVALMDTMTNVVGVLTIVLVMMGISLGRAASRVFSSLPPATEEQIRAAQAELDRMRAAQTPIQEKLKALSKPDLNRKKLATLDAEMAQLERTMKEKGGKPLDLDAISRELAKREAEFKQTKAAMDQLMAERDRLRALLDKTPAVEAPPAKVVRIPASRPIPEGAKIEHVLVTKDGPHWINIKATKTYFLNLFKASTMRPMIQSRVKRGDKTVVIYDYEKLARYFKDQKLALREFKIDVTWPGWTSSPELRLVPEGPSSTALRSTLEEFKKTPKTVVMFRVTAYGFDNYLAARKDCDEAGVPAGWEYAGASEYYIHVPEVETNKPKPPEQPKQPAKPAKPPAEPEIKAPPPKLD